MEMWSGWVVAVVLGLVLLGREVRARRGGQHGRAAVDGVLTQFDEALALAAQLTRDHDAMRESVERERRRAEEYLAIIEGVIAERDARMKLYYEQATEHGAAQALLLRQIESLVKQYQSVTSGKMPRLNPAVEEVTREFTARHVERAKSEQEAGGATDLTAPRG